MKNEAQNLQDCSGRDTEAKKYDVFISYRHLSNTDDDHRHSTSLARSVAQAFRLKGFTVFFDCWQDNPQICFNALEKSKYFIILVTKYSFCENGEGFKKELQLIKEIVDKDKSKKNNVFIVNVDNAYGSTKQLTNELSNYAEGGLEGIIKDLYTNSSFPVFINQLIKNPEERDNNKIRRKFPRLRLGYEMCKKALWAIPIIVLVAVAAIAFGINKQIQYKNQQKDLDYLKQYEDSCIIFAGGGTIQQYLSDSTKIGDINNYPISKYIHLPSTDAWSLLWDDVNMGEKRHYCPIVLSTCKIDTTDVNTKDFRGSSGKRRIVEFNLDATPLTIQVVKGHDKISNPICLEELKALILKEDNIVYTTTSPSGTYIKYRQVFLDSCTIDLDTCFNKQRGRRDFNRNNCIVGFDEVNKTKVYLGNYYFYYRQGGDRIKVIYDTVSKSEITTPLYVYTIAEQKEDYYKILPQAKRFLDSIGCNTDTTITSGSDMVFTMAKRKEQ